MYYMSSFNHFHECGLIKYIYRLENQNTNFSYVKKKKLVKMFLLHFFLF